MKKQDIEKTRKYQSRKRAGKSVCTTQLKSRLIILLAEFFLQGRGRSSGQIGKGEERIFKTSYSKVLKVIKNKTKTKGEYSAHSTK